MRAVDDAANGAPVVSSVTAALARGRLGSSQRYDLVIES